MTAFQCKAHESSSCSVHKVSYSEGFGVHPKAVDSVVNETKFQWEWGGADKSQALPSSMPLIWASPWGMAQV